MDNTPNLSLPYILAAQAQKHVTHNEAVRALDAVVQLAVLDRDLTAPPGSPADGERYIVGPGATGAWSGQESTVAAWQDGSWLFYAPVEGWLAWVADEDVLVAWDGSGWSIVGSGTDAQFDTLGVNATADATNKLAVASDASLFGHNGSDHQLKVNKAADGDTASVLFQTNFSGRAEFGLTGDDDFHMKVSPDGSAFHEGIVIDKSDGSVAMPNGIKHFESGAMLSPFLPTPGGAGQTSIYLNLTSRSQNPRTATISSVSSDVITLTTSDADLFFHAFMEGVSYVRIWNTSKTAPGESAWVKAMPSGDELQVTNAADIATWANGETVEFGDPTSETPNRCFALDISPLMQNQLGAVFRQSGALMKFDIEGTGRCGIDVTPTGISGSFSRGSSLSDGSINYGLWFASCTELSPISNSNLVFVREVDNGNSLVTGFILVFGLYL